MGGSASSYRPRVQENPNRSNLDLVAVINGYTMKTFTYLSNRQGNFLSSPFNLNLMLSILQYGAVDKAFAHLTAAIGHITESEAHEGFDTYLVSMKNADGITLEMANSVWLDHSLDVEQKFVKDLSDKFCADHFFIGFDNPEVNATTRINDWGSKKTAGKIQKTLEAEVASDSVLILVNVNYFRGLWKLPFRVEEGEAFHNEGTADSIARVHFLHQQDLFMYYKDNNLGAKFLEVDYEAEVMSMIFILPFVRDQICELEKRINYDTLSSALKQLQLTSVDVAVPMFRLEDTCIVKDNTEGVDSDALLKEIEEIFKSDAKFPGIGKNVKITSLEQKNVIELDSAAFEEPAANTLDPRKKHKSKGASRSPSRSPKKSSRRSSRSSSGSSKSSRSPCGSPEVVNFRADHPFLFLIYDKRTGMILFVGRMTNFLHFHKGE